MEDYNPQKNQGFVKHAFTLAFFFLIRTDLTDQELFDEAMF